MNKRFALWPVNIRGNFCIVAIVMTTAATSPSSSDIINGFSLEDDNHYNEFQSDSNATNDNTVKVTNKNLKAATFLLFFLLFFASNLPIKPLEQVKIARLMLEIDCLSHQHEQKICSLAS
jgi:hypothetical protein